MAGKETMEIRHLPFDVKEQLASYLDMDDFWIQLAKHITSPDGELGLLYNTQHINAIKQVSRSQGCSATTLLLNDWGTFGRKRPTVDDLMQLLKKSDHYHAVSFLAKNVLNSDFVDTNRPSTTELLKKVGQDETILNMPATKNGNTFQTGPGFSERFIESLQNGSIELSNPNIKKVTYEELCSWTNDFNKRHLLGSGNFSQVFLGENQNNAGFQVKHIAVKRIEAGQHDHFTIEAKVLSKLGHKNILQLYGYSISPQYLCLIFEYAKYGSLYDCLHQQKMHSYSITLDWFTRLKIANGIASGLVVVHTQDIVHKDVKSANIMLGDEMEPKLGDFGVAHESPQDGLTHLVTVDVAGTLVYMPKEALHGVITVKWDTYSFGVVLLELLSGRKPYDRAATIDLVSYFEENCKTVDQLSDVLDESASWNIEIAEEVYNISLKCLQNNRDIRPTMSEVHPNFMKILNQAYYIKKKNYC